MNFIKGISKIASENYKVHPVFTFGTEELEGIWVGKFETTGAPTTPTIKPNISSIQYQSVSE